MWMHGESWRRLDECITEYAVVAVRLKPDDSLGDRNTPTRLPTPEYTLEYVALDNWNTAAAGLRASDCMLEYAGSALDGWFLLAVISIIQLQQSRYVYRCGGGLEEKGKNKINAGLRNSCCNGSGG
jgi:hypothetical protein